jgi:protein-tyrosine-phosphatase
MKKTKILFICVHNSARSQMAAAFMNKSVLACRCIREEDCCSKRLAN